MNPYNIEKFEYEGIDAICFDRISSTVFYAWARRTKLGDLNAIQLPGVQELGLYFSNAKNMPLLVKKGDWLVKHSNEDVSVIVVEEFEKDYLDKFPIDLKMVEDALKDFEEKLGSLPDWHDDTSCDTARYVRREFQKFKKLLDRFIHETKTKE